MAIYFMGKNLFDGSNVAFEDPKIGVDLYAYKPAWLEEKRPAVDKHTGRAGGFSWLLEHVNVLHEGRGTKTFFSPGSSAEGKMMAEQYYKATRPYQGSLTTMGAPKTINTRYADVIRSHLSKWG